MKEKANYSELLKDPRWIKRRNEILTRDKNTCQFCGCQDKYLHVHHKEYWDGFLPWEYPDSILITLCEDCHELMHQQKDWNFDAEIGQAYVMYHSDYTNICIVYNIDYKNKLVYTLECDDGAGIDSIYDETSTFDYFNHRYSLCGREIMENDWFYFWFKYISEHLEKTPMPFRYNWELMLCNNPLLIDVLNREVDYE